MIDAILDYVEKAYGLPRPVWALLAGTLAAFGTQMKLRAFSPKTWSSHAREVAVQAVGFAAGFLVTYAVWPSHTMDALVAALVVGLWSPAAWSILLLVLGWWKPALRDALKGPSE